MTPVEPIHPLQKFLKKWFPSEDLNFWLCAIYDSRYSHQDYDSVLGGVHEINTPDLTSIHLSFFILGHI